MKIGIIAAMEPELALLVEALENPCTTEIGDCSYHTGTLRGVEVALMLCGIGKVNASIGTTLMIDRFQPDYIINTGVAGGFPDQLTVGDIVLSTYAVHHDVDATAFGYELGQLPNLPTRYLADQKLKKAAASTLFENGVKIFEGPVYSGDSFIHRPDQVENIAQNFPDIMAVEMEGAAIAQTCHSFSLPFLLVRSISDKVYEEKSSEMYEEFMQRAAKNSVQVVFTLLENMKSEK